MYKQNPFGNPDGARANLTEIEYSFVTEFPFGAQISKCQDELLNKRVIVGAKGSGKTVYLRKIQSILKTKLEDNKTGIYVDDVIDQNMNCTEKVIAFCDYYPKNTLSEKWTNAWKVAILLAVAHKFLYDSKLNIYIEDEQKNKIHKLLKNIDLFYDDAFSIYQFMSSILNIEDTMNKMNRLLDNGCWFVLNNLLKSILRNSPAIYIFLDSIDLEYERAPLHWLHCQKGLFYALMMFLQDTVFGEKLHMIMTLRDNVFTAILRSEHATKFSTETHIFTLDWNEQNIKAFLTQKIEKLENCYFLKQNADQKNIESWLSFDEIINEKNETEKLIDFIVRHTRHVPRDIIIVCNELSKMRAELENDKSIVPHEWVKKVILSESSTIGDELIAICAKNIRVNTLPHNGAQYGTSWYYTSDKYYTESTFTKLLDILELCKIDNITRDIIERINAKATELFGANVHLSDILWQNGALGYIDDTGLSHFHAQKFQGDNLLPKNKENYMLRPCVTSRLKV